MLLVRNLPLFHCSDRRYWFRERLGAVLSMGVMNVVVISAVKVADEPEKAVSAFLLLGMGRVSNQLR